ncbi:MAG: hypothetical protein GYA51_12040, partial [Candidatus Methanofastidiosa archaeon]|nr:hypothetical protein [Candidatus Methanofastidiosa archaeon]
MKVKKILLSELNSNLKKSYDLFICSNSFEERCLSVAHEIDKGKLKSVLILSYYENKIYTDKNLKSLKSTFMNNKEIIYLSIDNPLSSVDRISEYFFNLTEGEKIKSILIDITTFTHEFLLIIIRLFMIYFPNVKITVLYTNA